MQSTARVVVVLVALVALVAPASAAAGGPVVERSSDREVLPVDDYFVWLCGIETSTTIKESDTLKTWPDGSQSFHTDRSFVPADPRLPIERGAGTSYFAAGSEVPYRIVGKPIQLFDQGGGVLALDAGLTIVGDPLVHHGHLDVGFGHDDDRAYLQQFYCPWAST